MWTDTVRLQMLKAVGAEEFDTGQADKLWAVFNGEFFSPELGEQAVEGEELWLDCRLSDIAAHALVKDSALTRVSDGKVYLMRRHEPSRSSGFTIIRLKR